MIRKLISFEVAGQLFGLDITAIREIRAWSPVTRMPGVPGVPDYIAGMANLRGAIVPVMDLAARLGWERTVASERNAIIVVHSAGKSCGLIVESVSDLVELPAETLQPPPALGDAAITAFIEGLAPLADRMVMVINLAELIGNEVVRVG